MIWRKIFSSKILSLLLLICLIFLIIILYKNWLKESSWRTRYLYLKTKIAGLEKESQEIEKQLENFESEKENLARRLYPLKKPGEEVIIIPSEVFTQPSENTSSPLFIEKIFERIKKWLKF